MSKKWIVGFAKTAITPSDCTKNKYYLAGFGRGVRAYDVLDDIFVRSVYFCDDESGKGGVVTAVIDCIGICNKDINEIRTRVQRYLPPGSISSINIMSTHVHSAPDTQGLWGKGISCGVNKRFMKYLKEAAAECIRNSFLNAKRGDLFFGKILTQGMILDNRLPEVHDDHLNRLRFVPEDGSAELYILNIGCHPELLGENHHMISADWPCYMGRYIAEKTGAEFAFFNGAIGAITNMGMDEVYSGRLKGIEAMPAFGKKMGEYALAVKDEVAVPVKLAVHRVERLLSVENKTFALAAKLHLITNDVINVDAVRYNKGIITEVSLLEIGNIRILLVPGELFPELALGGCFGSDESATGKNYLYPAIFDMLGNGEKLIFGLANDQIGYIIPDNDFYISPKKPYAFWAIPDDCHGRAHYEETTCSGPFAAEMLRDATEQLVHMSGQTDVGLQAII